MTTLCSDDEQLTLNQRETLQEVANIGTGLAGDALAKVLKTLVDLSPPDVELISSEMANTKISQIIGKNTPVTVIQQAFFSHWRGEAIVIYDQAGCNALAPLMGYGDDVLANDVELLLDVSNLLTGACLNGIADQLSLSLSFSPPSVLSVNQPSDSLFDMNKLNWEHCLCIEVSFFMKTPEFKAHLFMMFSQESFPQLKNDLDLFVEGL